MFVSCLVHCVTVCVFVTVSVSYLSDLISVKVSLIPYTLVWKCVDLLLSCKICLFYVLVLSDLHLFIS